MEYAMRLERCGYLLSERLVLGGGLRPGLGKCRPLRRGGSAAPGRGTSAVPRTPYQFLSPVLVVTGTRPTGLPGFKHPLGAMEHAPQPREKKVGARTPARQA